MECYYIPETIDILENIQNKSLHIGLKDSSGNIAGVLLSVDEYRLIKHLSDLACTPQKYQQILNANAQFQKKGFLNSDMSLEEAFAHKEQHSVQALSSCAD